MTNTTESTPIGVATGAISDGNSGAALDRRHVGQTRPGQLAISTGLLSPSEMNINVYRSGMR